MATNFPQTLGAPPDDPGAFQVPPEEMQALQALQARMNAPAKPRYTPEEQAQRKATNDRDYALGMLGLYSQNETLHDAGAQVFKQALAERQPDITDHGAYNKVTGEFSYNPEYMQQRNEDASNAVLGRISAQRVAWQQARAAAADRQAFLAQRLEGMKDIKQMGIDNRPDKPEKLVPYTDYGSTPDGKQVVTDKQALRYVQTVNADGSVSRTPYNGPVIPRATMEKNIADVTENATTAQQAAGTLQLAKENPDAFGNRAALVGTLPATWQGRAAKLFRLSPAAMSTRADVVRQAAMETKQLYGAAQSQQEMAKAGQFIVLLTDDPDTAMTKLEGMRKWYSELAAARGPAALGAATARNPALTQALGAQGGASANPVDDVRALFGVPSGGKP